MPAPHSKAVPKRGGRYAGRLRLAVAPNRQAKMLQGFVVQADGWSPFNSFRSLLGIAVDSEAPTYDSLYRGTREHPWALTG